MFKMPRSLVILASLSRLEGSEYFSLETVRRNCSRISCMDRALIQMLLKMLVLMGSDQAMVQGSTGPYIRKFREILLLKRATLSSSHSSSEGKKLWLSPPRSMEIWLEWESTEVPVYSLHFLGAGNEKPYLLFKSSSIADSFKTWPNIFNFISVVRIIFPFPVYVNILALLELPWEYMLVGRVQSTDEAKLTASIKLNSNG